ncbi:hypothetical protein [Paracoccus yeei]|uniref:hypothetical protein n=1 Tax=Paracoccus yeei TaxID=147645 RepID=UPI003BF84990
MTSVLQFLAEGITAFYLGHSLVSPTLPEMMRDVTKATIQYQIINGAPLEVQWKESAVAQGVDGRSWIPDHPVDVLVLTERVPLAPTIEYHDSAGYAARWVKLALDANPRVQSYLYQTWDDIDDAQTGTTRTWRDRILSDLPQWQGIVDKVNAGLPADAAPMQLIPAGLGMVRLHDAIAKGRVPGADSIRDFFRDDIHPTDAGFYYVTMIHYAVLTGKSPVGLPRQLMGEYGAYPPVPKDQVEVLQQLAQETVAAFDKPD